jgi:hypothetical protein
MMAKPILYVWIPRTAGTTLFEAVAMSHRSRVWVKDRATHRTLLAVKPPLEFITYQHLSLETLIRRGVDLSPFCVAAFVRNPWGRLVSIYHHLRSARLERARCVATRHGDGFAAFAEWATSGDAPSAKQSNSAFMEHYVSPQVDWLTVGTQIQAAFVGKVERLLHDARVLLDRIHASAPPGHHNKSVHKPFRDYYDAALRDRAGKFYEQDCDTWGYTFKEETR